MPSSWLSLLPPVIVLISAVISHRIHISLLLGLITAFLVASHGSLPDALSLFLSTLENIVTNPDNLLLYGFLTCLGILVATFKATGSASSFAYAITQRIRSAFGLECASLVLSLCMFVDDYLSILAIGNMMAPIADQFKIAREKLAFLIHSFAGPIVILFPVSSWAATIIMYTEQAGVGCGGSTYVLADPFFAYLWSFPFMLYSFFIIISVWLIITYKLSFGPMRSYETHYHAAIQEPIFPNHASVWGLLLPLAVLITSAIIGLAYMGGYYACGGTHTFIESIRHNEHPFLVMLSSVMLAICVSMAMGCYQKTLRLRSIPAVIKRGFLIMYPSLGIVFLATLLSQLLANNLGTGHYLASLLLGKMSLDFLPVIFFVTSLVYTFATGSAWGSFAIMLPIAIPMLTSLSNVSTPVDPSDLPLFLPMLGAIFSGSVCGDHVSPISDTTAMTAASTQINPLSHTYTQFPYALPAIIGCMVGFFFSGYLAHLPFVTSTLISFLAGLSTTVILLFTLATRYKK